MYQSVEELRHYVDSGEEVKLDANTYNARDLRIIAAAASTQAKIVVCDSHVLAIHDIRMIAAVCRCQLIFD